MAAVTCRRPFRHLIALLVLGLLAACALKGDGTQAQLSRACQLITCVCDKVDRSLIDAIKDRQTVDIIWREDGAADCPAGYRLERKSARSIYDRPMY
jgi:hypothetical protein